MLASPCRLLICKLRLMLSTENACKSNVACVMLGLCVCVCVSDAQDCIE